MTVPSRALRALHDQDPAQEILDAVSEPLRGISVLGSRVLVAIYERPRATAGGILLTDTYRGEDVYQGKIGLVIALGDLAFKEDDTHHWDRVPKVGDWVGFRVGDTWPMLLGKKNCRMIEDVDVRLILTAPDVVY